MLRRCEAPTSPDYRFYGARGITVCDRWHDFEAFLADMGEPPVNTTLDRVDPLLHYDQSNCRWADRTTQAKNKRSTIWVEVEGVRLTSTDAAKKLGISRTELYKKYGIKRTPRGPRDKIVNPNGTSVAAKQVRQWIALK